MPDVKLLGTITKVEEGFAYASLDDGSSVFIPITACRTPNESLYDLRMKFSNNETVIMKVQLQPDQRKRNNCKWIAKSVKKGPKKQQVSDVVHQNVLATVTSSTESYGFAESDEFGTIFLPGNAFNSTIVKSVNSYIGPRTQLIVDIKEQIECKGCKYVAVKVTKRDLPRGQTEVLAAKKNEMIVSQGTVLMIENEVVLAVCSEINDYVHCPALAYRGKIDPINPSCHVAEIVSHDDAVQFKAVQSDDKWIAISWRKIDGADEDVHPSTQLASSTKNSESMTPPIIETLVLSHLLRNHPDLLQKYSFMARELPDSCLPDWYIVERDRHKFEKFQEETSSSTSTEGPPASELQNMKISDGGEKRKSGKKLNKT